MHLTPEVASVLSRFQRVRAGLVVGYSDDTMAVLKSHRDGVWMEIPLSDNKLLDFLSRGKHQCFSYHYPYCR